MSANLTTRQYRSQISDEEWFLERVTFEPNGCWSWSGSHAPSGYGLFVRPGRPTVVAHRFAYELAGRTIPEGLTLDHLCRNRGCINPDHLEPVTMRENILRGTSFSAVHARKTHCKHGHLLDETNTYMRPDGTGRQCRTCHRQNVRRSQAKAGAA